MRLTGWAYDPDALSAEIAVTLHRDGAPVARHATGTARPDINRKYGAAGRHGFDIVVDALPGQHSFAVYAAKVAAAGADSLIGGQTVTIEPVLPHPAPVSS